MPQPSNGKPKAKGRKNEPTICLLINHLFFMKKTNPTLFLLATFSPLFAKKPSSSASPTSTPASAFSIFPRSSMRGATKVLSVIARSA